MHSRRYKALYDLELFRGYRGSTNCGTDASIVATLPFVVCLDRIKKWLSGRCWRARNARPLVLLCKSQPSGGLFPTSITRTTTFRRPTNLTNGRTVKISEPPPPSARVELSASKPRISIIVCVQIRLELFLRCPGTKVIDVAYWLKCHSGYLVRSDDRRN